MFYVIDHCHATDHMKFCRVVKTRNDCTYSMYDVTEIIMAIQFYFEENVKANGDIPMNDLVMLLQKGFGFTAVMKNFVKHSLAYVLDSEAEMCCGSYHIWNFEDSACVYLDLYQIHERLSGPGQPEKLYEKWLTPEIMEDIKKMTKSTGVK